MTARPDLTDRVRRYYERYYRDTLGIPDWRVLVRLREHEEEQERARVERLRSLVGDDRVRGRVLNVGCGTGGFNVVLAESGARAFGVDDDTDAMEICAIKARKTPAAFARAAAEALPFGDGAFDLVYCFSTIEHVRSVEQTVREMVRVTRPGGAIYVHTPSAWSCYEGHYKVFWLPMMPPKLGKPYLALRGRPTGYVDHLRRLTPGRLTRAFRAAGVDDLSFLAGEPARETLGPLAAVVGLYYRATGVTPFIELLATKS